MISDVTQNDVMKNKEKMFDLMWLCAESWHIKDWYNHKNDSTNIPWSMWGQTPFLLLSRKSMTMKWPVKEQESLILYLSHHKIHSSLSSNKLIKTFKKTATQRERDKDRWSFIKPWHYSDYTLKLNSNYLTTYIKCLALPSKNCWFLFYFF